MLVVVFPAAAGAAVHTHLVGNFDTPIQVFAPRSVPGSTLYVVEKGGKIIRRQSGGHRNVVLDIHGHVSSGGEQGLLSAVIADRKLFVYYTNRDGDSRVVRYTLNSGLGHVQSGSKSTILRQHQPFNNHNGGTLQFRGGHLYLSLGDGGDGCDTAKSAQNLNYEARQAPPPRLERLEDRWLRAAQPLALVVRPHDGRPLHRRRRPVDREEVDFLDASRLGGTPENYGWNHYEGNLERHVRLEGRGHQGPRQTGFPEVRVRPRRRVDGHRRFRLPRLRHAGPARPLLLRRRGQ